MLIQVISDLHLETYPSYGQYKHKVGDAPYLALLGDIGHVCDDSLFELFRKFLDYYFVVFYLLGNHDPKNLSMDAAKARVRKFEQEMACTSANRSIGKFVFLDQTRYDLDSTTTILGCTLFSNVLDEQKIDVGFFMIDFQIIQGWTVDDHNAAHASDVKWLNAEVSRIQQQEPNRKIVIFSHHCPTVLPQARDPRHEGSPVSSGFATDLSAEVCWTSPNVSLWAFGHTHTNCDFIDDVTGKKVFANQKGYFRFPQATFRERASLLLPEGQTQTHPDEEEEEEPRKLEEPSSPATFRKVSFLRKMKTGIWRPFSSRVG